MSDDLKTLSQTPLDVLLEMESPSVCVGENFCVEACCTGKAAPKEKDVMFVFEVGGVQYAIEKDGEEILVYRHISGEQKSIIIQEILKIISSDEVDFRAANSLSDMDRMLDYVRHYAPGNKTDEQTTRTLGKALYNYLEIKPALDTFTASPLLREIVDDFRQSSETKISNDELLFIYKLKMLLENAAIDANCICDFCLYVYQRMKSVRFDPEKQGKQKRRIDELLKKLPQDFDKGGVEAVEERIQQFEERQ